MGHKQSRGVPVKQNSFKLFEYQCPNCKVKRPIQYFYRDGVFLAQAPRVVCGGCNCSVAVEPFKAVDYCCPACKKWQKVRLPAKPVPLNMYNVSKVSCNCGFRGEVTIGRRMDVACSKCWTHKRELRDVWTEDGDEARCYCDNCQEYQRSFARTPQKKGQQGSDMEYNCEGCRSVRPIGAEELLRNQGLVCCDQCGWVGYPEVLPKGQLSEKAAAVPIPPSFGVGGTGSGGSKGAKPRGGDHNATSGGLRGAAASRSASQPATNAHHSRDPSDGNGQSRRLIPNMGIGDFGGSRTPGLNSIVPNG